MVTLLPEEIEELLTASLPFDEAIDDNADEADEMVRDSLVYLKTVALGFSDKLWVALAEKGQEDLIEQARKRIKSYAEAIVASLQEVFVDEKERQLVAFRSLSALLEALVADFARSLWNKDMTRVLELKKEGGLEYAEMDLFQGLCDYFTENLPEKFATDLMPKSHECDPKEIIDKVILTVLDKLFEVLDADRLFDPSME